MLQFQLTFSSALFASWSGPVLERSPAFRLTSDTRGPTLLMQHGGLFGLLTFNALSETHLPMRRDARSHCAPPSSAWQRSHLTSGKTHVCMILAVTTYGSMLLAGRRSSK